VLGGPQRSRAQRGTLLGGFSFTLLRPVDMNRRDEAVPPCFGSNDAAGGEWHRTSATSNGETGARGVGTRSRGSEEFRPVALIPLPPASRAATTSKAGGGAAQQDLLCEDDVVWLICSCGGRLTQSPHSPAVHVLSRSDYSEAVQAEQALSLGLGWGHSSSLGGSSTASLGVSDAVGPAGGTKAVAGAATNAPRAVREADGTVHVELVLSLETARAAAYQDQQPDWQDPRPPPRPNAPPRNLRIATSLHWLLDAVSQYEVPDLQRYGVAIDEQ